VIETKRLTLAAGASETVSFTVTKDVVATYNVELGGLRGSFKVVEQEPLIEPPVPGLGLVLAIAGLLTVAYLVLRRKRKE